MAQHFKLHLTGCLSALFHLRMGRNNFPLKKKWVNRAAAHFCTNPWMLLALETIFNSPNLCTNFWEAGKKDPVGITYQESRATPAKKAGSAQPIKANSWLHREGNNHNCKKLRASLRKKWKSPTGNFRIHCLTYLQDTAFTPDVSLHGYIMLRLHSWYLNKPKKTDDVWRKSVKCLSCKDCTRPTYHEVTSENQGDDLCLRWGVAIIITGQVPPLPPAVREPILPIVLGAEHPVQAEEQEDQDNARGQTQSSHPGGRDKQT